MSPVQSHLLIGPPGSGKSTLAQHLQAQLPQSCIISTDRIRQHLYGDTTDQGDWTEIETHIHAAFRAARDRGDTIIYDATNAKRVWRMTLMQHLAAAFADAPLMWIGWHLTTPLATCHQWNQQRSRTVPAAVIDAHHTALKQFPPLRAEGFTALYHLPPPGPDFDISPYLTRLHRSHTNRANRTQHAAIQWHRYSPLLAFDRLLHLISLLIQHPGLGSFHQHQPDHLHTLLPPSHAPIHTALDEISAVLTHHQGALYGDPIALAQDLHWLGQNGCLSPHPTPTPLTLPPPPPGPINPHPYSDWEPFQRLMHTIRYISHHPFAWDADTASSLHSLVQAMQAEQLLQGDRQAAIRKDIEQVLKPFGILPPVRLRRGYCFGTGLLSAPQLSQLTQWLQTQAKTLQDPIALSLLETLEDRLRHSHHTLQARYPVRAIAHRFIVDPAGLPQSALVHHPDTLAYEIETGQLLELNTFPHAARFDTDPQGFFLAWPLQIVFHNIAWYLGYEIAAGPQLGLLKFQRLDRLFRGRPQSQRRSRHAQGLALKALGQLHQASGGLYLGDSVQQQQQFLNPDPAVQAEASLTLELWCTDTVYSFISEGTQRFPKGRLKLSPRSTPVPPALSSLFTLAPSPDPSYPHRFQVTLPCWCDRDFDLRRWLMGFGAGVKVITPKAMQHQIYQLASQICAVYGQSDRAGVSQDYPVAASD